MTLNDKIEEYVSIVNQGVANITQQITVKMINEEDKYTNSQVKKFVRRIEKETGFELDEATLWNEVRDK